MSGVSGDDPDVLARKLAALGYDASGALSSNSTTLVSSLLDDLVHTTEAYRALKAREEAIAGEASVWQGRMEAIRKENSRLVRDNNQLHQQMVLDAERRDMAEAERGERLRTAEEEVARLSFWKQQQAARQRRVEQENNALRSRVDELLSKAARSKTLGGETMEMGVEPSRIVVSGPLAPRDPEKLFENNKVKREGLDVNYMKQSDARIASAEHLSRALQADVAVLREALDAEKDRVARRDSEINRLSSLIEEEGRDVDTLGLQYKNESNERLVLSLNQQVDFLTETLAQAQAKVTDFERLEKELEAAEAGLSRAEAAESALKEELLIAQAKAEALGTNPSITEEERLARQDYISRAAVDAEAKAALEKEVASLRASLQSAEEKLKLAREETKSAISAREAAALRLIEAEARCVEVDAATRQAKDLLAVQSSAVDRVSVERDAAISARDTYQEAADAAAYAEQKALTELKKNQEQRVAVEAELEQCRAEVKRLVEEVEMCSRRAQGADTSRVKAEIVSRDAATERAMVLKQLEVLQGEIDHVRKALELEASQRAAKEAELSNLKAQHEVVERDLVLLQEELSNKSSRLAEGAANAATVALSQSQLSELKETNANLQKQISTLNEELGSAIANAASALNDNQKKEREIVTLEEEQARLEDLLRQASSDKKVAEERVLHMEFESQHMKQRLGELDETRGSEREVRESLTTELAQVRDTFRGTETSLVEAESALHKATIKIEHLEKEFSRLSEENAMVSARLSKANESLEVAQRAEEEASAASSRAREEVRASNADRDAAKLEAEMCATRCTSAEKRAAEMEVASDSARAEATQYQRDVERLKTLISSLDGTRDELVKKLHLLSDEGKRLKIELREQVQATSEAKGLVKREQEETRRLSAALAATDAERDNLQAELDMHAEELESKKMEVSKCKEKEEEMQVCVANAESRAAASERQVEASQEDNAALASECETLKATLLRTKAELSARNEDLHALSDDLSAMTREQQVVNAELNRKKQEMDHLSSELSRVGATATSASQRLRVKEKEMEELIVAYQELGVENRRLNHNLSALERDLQAALETLQQREAAVDAVRIQVREVEEENRRYVVDLQAFERQVDSLSRQLARSEERHSDISSKKVSTLHDLGTAQQVILELERARDGMQRDLGQVASRLDTANARLADVVREKAEVVKQLQSEKFRSRGLDEMVAQLRMKLHALPSQKNVIDPKNSNELEELHYQVTMLQASLESESTEVKRLEEALRVAKGGGGEGGGEVVSLVEEKERLLALLGKLDAERTQLQRDNERLVGEVSLLRSSGTSASSSGEGGGGGAEGGFLLVEELRKEKDALATALRRAESTLTRTQNELAMLKTEYELLLGGSAGEEEE